MWDEITYPFPNFTGDYISMLGSKLTHITEFHPQTKGLIFPFLFLGAAIHTSTTPQGGASNRAGRKPPPTIPNNYKLENFGITGHGLK